MAKINSERLVTENLLDQLSQLSDITVKELSFPIPEKIFLPMGGELLGELEKQTGIISGMSKCIIDDRDQRYINHSQEQLLSKRIYQIAPGYKDANDCDELWGDSIFKICSSKLPQREGELVLSLR